MTTPTHDAYLAAVRDLLPALPAEDRASALEDLRDALAAIPVGTDPAVELGPPEDYAAAVVSELAPPRDPDSPEPAQATVLGMPAEGRGATDARIRARIWNPTDERVWVPRLMGAGWTLNLGAVAPCGSVCSARTTTTTRCSAASRRRPPGSRDSRPPR